MGNLTLNLGVRFENEHIPSFKPEIQKDVIDFGFGDKIAPRIGAAYDLFGDGRVKAFGSYGRYYDWTKYELSRGSFGGDIWQVYYRSLDDPNVIPQINLSNLPGRDLFGSATGFRDFRIPTFDTVDPSIKPMSQDSYSAGVDFQLGRSSVFTVNYIHNELVRTIEDIGLVVDGNEVYLYANPGEGIATNALISTQTAPFTIPKPKRQYDALQLSVNRRFSGNWFIGEQLRLQPSLRQLRGHRQLRRNPHAGEWFFVRIRSAAGDRRRPARWQRQSVVGPRRDDVGRHRAIWMCVAVSQRIVPTCSSCTARICSRSARSWVRTSTPPAARR